MIIKWNLHCNLVGNTCIINRKSVPCKLNWHLDIVKLTFIKIKDNLGITKENISFFRLVEIVSKKDV